MPWALQKLLVDAHCYGHFIVIFTGRILILLVCLAELLTMAGVFAFPALVPGFIAAWGLSNAEAGWISGIYFLFYAITAPTVIALTDRLDARFIYAGGAVVAGIASAGFAVLADGFWTALIFRALAGAGLAATYMPGLRMLMDRYVGSQPSRAVACYTASFSLGAALSFLLAGEISTGFGWRLAFAVTAGMALLAAPVPFLLASVRPPRSEHAVSLLDFRPIFANRQAMGYILAYSVHVWELFVYRAWLVAFLAAAALADPPRAQGWPSPTGIAALSGLVAVVASIGGNELCVRFGRLRVIMAVMTASALSSAAFGFSFGLGYGWAAVSALVYIVVIQLDSAALTAGALESAGTGQRGATLALHSFLGFTSAGVGPLATGVVLDAVLHSMASSSAVNGDGRAWSIGFLSVAAVALLGPIALCLARPNPSRGKSA